MTTKITITGTKGFLGNYLSNYFTSQPNTKIYELSSSINKIDNKYYFIGNKINEEILKDTDVLILCAHDFKKKDEYFQVNGFEVIFKQIRKLSLNIKIIYISSLAAFDKSETTYGKSKYLMEQSIIDKSGIIIKPGIIYGDKNINGLINKISDFTNKYKLVPYFLNLNSKIYITHIEDLCFVINKILINEKSGTFLCASLKNYTFKQLVIKFSSNKKIILIPILWQFLYYIIKLLELLRIKKTFKSDSILNLAKQNKTIKENTVLEYAKYFRD